jgi:conjugal transfer pilus assembly protein TraW
MDPLIRRVLHCLVAWSVAATGLAQAATVGTIGPVYPIAEKNLLELIAERLRAKERSGELGRLQQESVARATASVTSPPPVAGIRTAQVARTVYFDPSVVLEQNVVDASGKVLYPAGTRKNPLDVVSLSKSLLFFDARDPRQVLRARELIDRSKGPVKPILVGGSYMDLMKRWKTPVYADQQGALVRKLGILAVPAFVSQEGKLLRIDEVPPQ